jgi:hypothetical protein
MYVFRNGCKGTGCSHHSEQLNQIQTQKQRDSLIQTEVLPFPLSKVEWLHCNELLDRSWSIETVWSIQNMTFELYRHGWLSKTTAFWDISPCSLVEVNRLFRGVYWSTIREMNLSSWWVRQYAPLKRRSTSTILKKTNLKVRMWSELRCLRSDTIWWLLWAEHLDKLLRVL